MKHLSQSLLVSFLFFTSLLSSAAGIDDSPEHRLLYVAVPGIRDYLQYGGHGILLFDIDHGHKFLNRLPCSGLDEKGKPLNVKGICASAPTARLYVTTTKSLSSFDVISGKVLWEKSYEGGCDRLSITPDGKIIYLPSLEGDHWHVVDALSGRVIKKLVLNSGAHNTIIGPDGKFAYLAGLKSPVLRVANTTKHEVVKEVGPFGAFIRPFTINSSQTFTYVNVNGLLGFEVGDLNTGKFLHRVVVEGFQIGETKRHGCPSHGIGLTPDDKELWLTDAANSSIHIFDNRVMPPKQMTSILLRDQPGWVTFSINGKLAYPSTGDVIDVPSRKIVAELTDEKGAAVQSEKLLEIDFKGNKPIRAGNQFGIGTARADSMGRD
ncbi:MAG TPA: hypothetical protein VLT36_17670 [Candidatus Dormibacteraeota bacterium]|nr:hypothetical protein [Candidatus Dormibacteraeota bacterium]